MRRFTPASLHPNRPLLALLVTTTLGLGTAVVCFGDLPDEAVTLDQVTRGRMSAVTKICADCHNRGRNTGDPSDPHWLAGFETGAPPFQVVFQGKTFKTYPRNLTPDNVTGIGRLTERQIFNALRYGLKPSETPDVVITSSTPGQGNFPADPRYLAPPMQWPLYRHLPDNELWDIIAYLKHGLKAVSNKVPDSEGPPDFWVSFYTPDMIGVYPFPVFPAGNEEFKP
jgi:mono/diheme cytochrome c family protein